MKRTVLFGSVLLAAAMNFSCTQIVDNPIAEEPVPEEPVSTARVWDFTKWSEATVANLKADAANGLYNWSDVEKDPAAKEGNPTEPTDASRDNCFWLQADPAIEDGVVTANGVAVAELEGLKFNSEYAGKRSLAIAVNYPETSLGSYAGASYLWLGGGGSKQSCPCFTIPEVKAGQTLTVVAESHKPSDARGIQIYANEYAAENQIGEAFKPTTQASYTWTIESDCDVVVWNTSGCHIYTITVEDAAEEQPAE